MLSSATRRTGVGHWLAAACFCLLTSSVAAAQTHDARRPDPVVQRVPGTRRLPTRRRRRPRPPPIRNPRPARPPPTPTQQQGETQLPKLAIDVTVTAPRVEIPLKDNPAATTVVTQEELKSMPRTVGADEALMLVPGVKVDNQADGERVHLSIRGQGLLTERGIRGITVLLDGLPLNDPTGLAPDLFDVDWASVQRIEVLRGSASALYGGGSSGGVINITTRDGGAAPLTGQASLEAGDTASSSRTRRWAARPAT